MSTPYHAKFFAHELTLQRSSDSIDKLAPSLSDIRANVALNPHQVDAALFAFSSSLPICYGRRSASRSGQFTMVFGGKPVGTAKLADLRQTLPADKTDGISQAGVALMKGEVEALAMAEGIWKSSNKTHWTGWGLVAIAVNPHSAFHHAIRAMWITNFSPGSHFESVKFGPTVVDKNGILESALPWESDGMSGLDFCLATPTMPDTPLPSPQQIAEAILHGSYFNRTVRSGIATSDDGEIKRCLSRMF